MLHNESRQASVALEVAPTEKAFFLSPTLQLFQFF